MANVLRDDKLVQIEAPIISLRGDDGTEYARLENGVGTGLLGGSITYVAAPVGVDDTAIIQSAITARAAAGGGIVQLRKGTYVSQALLVPSNIDIRGSGKAVTTIQLKAATDDALFANADPVGGNSHFCIRDMTLDGNRGNQTTPTGVSGAGGYSSGIRLRNASNVLIQNVDAGFFKDYGLTIGGEDETADQPCDHIYVQNSDFHDTGDDGVDVKNAGTQYVYFFQCKGYNQQDTGSRSGIGARSGFEFNDGGSFIYMVQCEAYNCKNSGFEIHSHAAQPTNMSEIHHVQCVSHDNQRGFSIDIGDDETRLHSRITYTACQAYNCSLSGYLAQLAQDSAIVSCVAENCLVGIEIQDTIDGLLVEGNTLIGADSGDNFTTGAFGIRTDLSYSGSIRKGISIVNNKIRNYGAAGIRLDGGDLQCTVAFNEVRNNGRVAGTATASKAAIALFGNVAGGSYEIIGNRCYDDQGSPTQQYGISLRANFAASASRIINNRLDGNASSAIAIEAGSSLSGCDVRGNKGFDTGLTPAEIDMAAEGIVAEPYSRVLADNASVLTSQLIYAIRVPVRAGQAASQVAISVGTAGSGTAPTLFKIALLDGSFNVIDQTANLKDDAKLTSTGTKVFTLSGGSHVFATDGDYYLAVLQNGAFGSTAIQLLKRIAGAAAGLTVIGSGQLPAANQSTQTDFAANGSPQTLVAPTSASLFWVALVA